MKKQAAWLISVSSSVLAVPAMGQVQAPPNTEVPASSVSQTPSLTEPADQSAQGEVIVTAQKRAESVQNVPIAVSAYNEDALRSRGIDGAGNLVLAIPNLVFQKSRNTLQIRGVGRQLTTVAGDDGVGVHTNNAPLLANTVGLSEFYDIERVEVLRGPQGTLFGRSATGGVLNLITNKPTARVEGEISVELGNYDSVRTFGHFNLPLTDALSLRVAGFGLRRDGYTTNILNGDDVDGRRLWSTRVTLGYKPDGPVRAFALWEHFRENDTRGTRKSLCAKDPGLTSVLGVPTGAAQVAFTQGCLPRSVYADDIYGATNQLSTFTGILARQLGIQPVDSFAGKTIPRDLRKVEVVGPSIFRAKNNLFQFNAEFDVADDIVLSSLSSYSKNSNLSRGDTTYGYPTVPFPITSLVPTGIINSGTLGPSDRLQVESILLNDSDEFSQETRLQSSFDGPINFNLGGIYLKYNTHMTTVIAANVLDTIAVAQNRTLPVPIYIDPLPSPDFTGHNYFQSSSFYHLESVAGLGEVYYQPSEKLKFTLGLRYTNDDKELIGSGSTLLTPGRGLVFNPAQRGSFRALTGRFNISYSPDLSFTDKTLIYASVARGYKGGGFNTPGVVALGLPERFKPEFVNGFEFGTKNTLAGGRVTLNVNGFYYNYANYQVARSVNRATFVENVDAKISGLEFEGAVEPVRGLRLNANVGYLHSEITKGQAVDSFYRSQNDPTYIYGNSTSGGCILNAAGVAAALQVAGVAGVLANSACSGTAVLTTRLTALRLPAAQVASLVSGIYSYGPNVSRYSTGAGEGIAQDLKGNDLPNAPRLTLSLGAQYTLDLGSSGWDVTLRGDYYRQSSSFSRYNNAFFDRIRPWTNINGTLTFEKRDLGLTIQLYVKNALDKDTIVSATINDENLGASRNLSILDPRLFGVLVTKSF